MPVDRKQRARPEDGKLAVPEPMDARHDRDPCNCEDQNTADVIGHRQPECAAPESRGDKIQEHHRFAMRKPEGKQPVMDVVPIREENRPEPPHRRFSLPIPLDHRPEDAPRDGEGRVEDGETERERRDDDGECRRPLRRTDHRKDGEHEPEEQTSRIAEEDPRRVEIEAKETKQRTGQDQRDHGGSRIMKLHERDRGDRDRGNHRNTGGKPVESVDQVQCVHDPDDPEDRRGIAQPGKIQHPFAEGLGNNGDAHSRRIDDGANENLKKEFLPRPKLLDVVPGADGKNHQTGESKAKALERSLPRRRELIAVEKKDDRDREEDSDVDGHAAETRNGMRVDLALIRMVDCPYPVRQLDDERRHPKCCGQRNDKRNEENFNHNCGPPYSPSHNSGAPSSRPVPPGTIRELHWRNRNVRCSYLVPIPVYKHTPGPRQCQPFGDPKPLLYANLTHFVRVITGLVVFWGCNKIRNSLP